MSSIIQLRDHARYTGYINVTDLIKALLSNSDSKLVLEFDSASLHYVANISDFKAEVCGDVLLQIVQEHLNAFERYGVECGCIDQGEDFDFNLFMKVLNYWFNDDDATVQLNENLTGTVHGFIDDDSIYLYLGV